MNNQQRKSKFSETDLLTITQIINDNLSTTDQQITDKICSMENIGNPSRSVITKLHINLDLEYQNKLNHATLNILVITKQIQSTIPKTSESQPLLTNIDRLVKSIDYLIDLQIHSTIKKSTQNEASAMIYGIELTPQTA